MATKVLVFESDAAFASELRSELSKLGCTVSVVDDGNVGLQQAAADRPDLILLSIELPRMNGFSVCNKLKKDPALKDVPLIIMSSESSDETFEQHRKLRTRAEDYVHKPITFGDLVHHIDQFVKISGGGSDGQIVIEDEISLAAVELEDEGTQIARRPPVFSAGHGPAAPPPSPPASTKNAVDADIDAFTDAAFGMLEGNNAPPSLEPVNGHGRAPSEKPIPARAPTGEFRAAQSAPPPPVQTRTMTGIPAPATRPPMPSIPPRIGADPAEVERLKGDLERAKGEVERAKGDTERARALNADLERELASARSEIAQAREAASRGEDDAERATRAEAEVTRMQRDIDELKTKLTSASKGGAGVSSREFLDLREALNKKDKEILNLREQVTKKEREVLENGDALLTLERAKSELEEQSAEFERGLTEARQKIESLSADKDQAKKASEDFKARHARAQADLEVRTKELAEARSRGQENEARAEAELAALRADMQQSLDREREERDRSLEELETLRGAEAIAAAEALEQAKVNAARERSDALIQRERELRQETDGKLAALHRAHTDEMNRVKADHTQKLGNAEKTGAERLAAREAELEAARASEVEALRHERDEKVATMERDHQSRSDATAREHAEKVGAIESDRDERLARSKRETDERVASLENDRDAQVAALEARLARELAEGRAVAEAQKAAADEQIAGLERELGDLREELTTLRNAKLANDAANTARINELEQGLAATEKARDEAQKGLADARDRIAQMEIDLSGVRGELSDTRRQLDTETARAARAFAKWESDRTSLDRAKDALAVALQQIEDAEARTLD
jgi:CheY-like chemotaxis protein